MTVRTADPMSYAAVAQSLVERVFGAVGVLREQVLECRSVAASRRELLQARHFAALRPGMGALLHANRDIVVGMGMIVAAGVLRGERQRMQWWQLLPGRDQPTPLRVDLNPDSLGFYDCDSAEWFSVPRSTGRRHIVGPYVDALGTDRYLLTFTAPVIADGTFLGVVGADVPVARFERLLLRAWANHEVLQRTGLPAVPVNSGGWPGPLAMAGPVAPTRSDVLIINSQGRVVVSNCVRALSGELVADDHVDGSLRLDLPDVPWQVLLSEQQA